ncbi:family 2 glycosyl transferase [Eggerthella sp. CAG:368]|nr:family 2 glycosyl transferase [Eggerthella sp. CAG:368]
MGLPLVSVLCITFNQEKYIAQTLDSLVSQKTNFPFEVIVHDDASTDGTSRIIKEYEKRHPNIIKPILQKENQYSQGKLITQLCAPYLSGKYFAICEGDDFWLNDNKLQIQFDYMEDNPDCSLCVHGVKKYNNHKKKFEGKIAPSSIERDFSLEEILIEGGGLFGTNSMFLRMDDYLLPDEYLHWGMGDYPRYVYLASIGRVHYLPGLYAAYRVGVEGSWSDRTQKKKAIYIEGLRRTADCINGLYGVLDESYNQAIRKAAAIRETIALSEEGKWKEITQGEYSDCFKQYDLLFKIRLFVRCKAPRITGYILGRK